MLHVIRGNDLSKLFNFLKNSAIMGKHFLLIVFVAIQFGTIQGQTNDEMLKIKYYEASELNKKKEYEASNRKLDEVQKLFGRNNLRIQYLRVKNYYALNNFDQTKKQIVEYIKLKPEEDDALHEIMKYKAEIEEKEKIEQERLRVQREEQERLRLERERQEKLMTEKKKQYNLIINAIQTNQPNALLLVNEYLRNNARNDIYYKEMEEAKNLLILDTYYKDITRLLQAQNNDAAFAKCKDYMKNQYALSHKNYDEIFKHYESLLWGKGEFIDSRDNRVYKFVKIGTQVWMAENLAFKPNFGNFWAHGNKLSNVETYGYLYDFNTACKVCPKGWHLPNDLEWQQLIDYVGKKPGIILKARSGFDNYGNGTNNYGFSALPGGCANGTAGSMGYMGCWWTSTRAKSNNAWVRQMMCNQNGVLRYRYGTWFGFSVRCIKD